MFTVFVFVGIFTKKTFFHFSSWGKGEGGREVGGKPKLRTSFQFGERGGGVQALLFDSPQEKKYLKVDF